jgi:hypothetical protein
MPFVILPTNSVSGGYDVTNSLRFNFGSSDYLTRTPSTSGNRRTFTISVWLKRSLLSSGYPSILSNNNNGFGLDFSDTNFIRFAIGTSSDAYFYTTQLFRDPSAWYHIVAVVDTTDATSTDRMKLYVNGTRVTSFSTSVFPAQNVDTNINTSGIANQVGANTPYSSYFSGYMSEFYLIDGQALTPSSFGETDFDTGIWKPKAYTGTYGTNGFYLQFKNSASLGTDSSGNGNTFTVNNLTSVDQSTDTPTNNFCTWNSLSGDSEVALTEGNLKAVGSTQTNIRAGTISVSTGKWFWESKVTGSNIQQFGFINTPIVQTNGNQVAGATLGYIWINGEGGVIYYNGNIVTNPQILFTTNDIIGIALDLDNLKIYWYKNGSLVNSGGTTVVAGDYTPVISAGGGTDLVNTSTNFGNPNYTANGYTDSAGFGNFSYAVPSGYYSLCTKNLATYG